MQKCDVKKQAVKASEETGIIIPFQRTRRITGYLVGTVDRFCNAKAKEVADRIPHTGVIYNDK